MGCNHLPLTFKHPSSTLVPIYASLGLDESKGWLVDFAGYKMCARLYLDGNGVGKGRYMSLFFALMKGPYDPILPWPFTHRVTLRLLDQSGQGIHEQGEFMPDPTSPSFQQPRSEMNVATGCPLFISLGELERRKGDFMRDNTMFIKIDVEWIPPLQ